MNEKLASLAVIALLAVGCAGARAPQSSAPAADPTPAASAPTATPTPTPTPATTAQAPAPAPAPAPATPPTFAGLTVEETLLGDTLPDAETGALDKLYQKRLPWRDTPKNRVAAMNKALAPFGYHVTFTDDRNIGHPQYTVLHGDTEVAADQDWILPVAVNARGDDFALLVDKGATYRLLRPGREEAWDSEHHQWLAPVFAGNDLISVFDELGSGRRIPGPFSYQVLAGNRTVFSEQFQWDQVPDPIKQLTSWQGHWVLEVNGRVLIDGKPFGADQGYDQVFGWHLIREKPFYYFIKNGKTGIVYDGQVFPQQYDLVLHYKCCSGGAYNPGGSEHMSWFYGQRDGKWYYVEMGIYPVEG